MTPWQRFLPIVLAITACTEPPSERPASCGNGVLDDTEACEGREGCAPDELCSNTCACEPFPQPPASSQTLIREALEAGTIDYHTSLLYRLWALFQAPELPEAYEGAGSIGEDNGVFFELAAERASLPAEIEAAVAPYLVRPTDPTSLWSQIPGRSAVWSAGCAPNAEGLPDWRVHDTTHFAVWSCGGGVEGTDLHAARRVVAGTVFEEAWDAMIGSGDLRAPRPDEYPTADEEDTRIDVYLLELNQCRSHSDGCQPIAGNPLGLARSVVPCDDTIGGVETSSGYVELDVSRVPEVMSGVDAASKVRNTAAHELFHLVEFGLNLEAQGTGCAGGPIKSWLTEASAEWASHSYFPKSDPRRRTSWFARFQGSRIDTMFGLQALHDYHPYDAFLYPWFVTEEDVLTRDVMLDLWMGSRFVHTPEQLDDRFDRRYPFVVHFRDFTVTNFNRDLPGNPLDNIHELSDEALPFDAAPYRSRIVAPDSRFDATPLTLPHSLLIAPLAMQTEHFVLEPATRWFRYDATGVDGARHLNLDLLVKIDGQWSRRRLGAPVFAICREHPSDDVEEMYLIFSNAGHHVGDAIADRAEIRKGPDCPGGWDGEIRVETTYEEHAVWSDAAGATANTRLDLDTQTWSIVGTRRETPPGYPKGFELETIDTHWSGTFAKHAEYRFVQPGCGESVTTESGTDSGSGQTSFSVAPLADGRYALAVAEMPESYDVDIAQEYSQCAGGSGSSTVTQSIAENAGTLLVVPEIAQLTPVSEEEPGVFAGSTVYQRDVQPIQGGESVYEVKVSWSLRRTETE